MATPRPVASEQARHSRLGVPSNLPAEVSSFVGRHDDLARGADLLGQSRLVTLTGAGGCGKTRLAQRLAATTAPLHPDGVWWIELAPVADGATTGSVLARAMGLHVPEAAATGAVLEHLAAARGLVVLDNCEHIVDDVAGFVDRLLRATASVRVMCTSRQPIGVEGEVSWRVPSLEVPPLDVEPEAVERFDAARLFVLRAAQARPGSAVPAAAVAQICRRLDGIPLALELAAARTASVPPDRMLAQLDDRFRLLSRGPRSAVARQQTLLASVEWSHDLLEPLERALLRRLGVFAGGFTAVAAEAVAGFAPLDPSDVQDVLAVLTDKSMVQLEDSGRYRLLETIREYALARLRGAGETIEVADRHLSWLAALAEALEPDVDRALGPALDRIEAELPNLRAAFDHAAARANHDGLRLAAALGHFWVNRTWPDVGRDCTDRVLAANPDGPRDLRAKARLAGGYARIYGADPAGGIAEAVTALADAEAAQDVRTCARCIALISFGQAQVDPVAAFETASAGLAQARAAQDRWAEARLSGRLALCFSYRHRPADAEPALQRYRSLVDEVGDRGEQVWVLFTDGLLAAMRGHVDVARRLLLAFVAESRTIGDLVKELIGCELLATVELDAGRPRELVGILDGTDHRGWVADGPAPPFFRMLSEAAMLDEEPERAAAALIAGGRAQLPYFPVEGARLVLTGAALLLRTGDADRARGVVDELLAMSERISSAFAGTCRVLQARIERTSGDGPAAERLAHHGLGELMDAGLLVDVPDALDALGGIAIGAGSAAGGLRLLAAAAARRRETGQVGIFAADAEEDRARAVTALGEDADRVQREGAALDLDAAVAYARRARGERKRPSFGWESLTPMELEVVRLAAQGLTNPVIARKLYVSLSTVKTHLLHVFAKLGVTSRTELAAVATGRDLR